jgi:cyclic dehypoxanthinyl futalosine synthase
MNSPATSSLTLEILDQAIAGRRISEEQALHLLEFAELPDLGLAAQRVRNRLNDPAKVSYVVDRNVNYTNICSIHCTFCAFYRRKGDPDSYVLTKEELKDKALETKAAGGTGFLLQGGVNTELPWHYYLDLVAFLHHDLGLWVHGFSPVEIQQMARLSGQGLIGTLRALREAGLGSLPGGGAEILVDRMRKKLSPRKGDVASWLEVMDAAHEVGLMTTGTMMYGITNPAFARSPGTTGQGLSKPLGGTPYRLRCLALSKRSYPLGREGPQSHGYRVPQNNRYCTYLP